MYRQEDWMEVKVMHRQGASIRAISRRTGLSRSTVRKILRSPVAKDYGPRPARPGKLDPFVERLRERLSSRPYARATVLYEEIRREGYGGHYEGVKRWVRGERREAAARRRACVRFETAPGLEGQFDWKGPVRGLLASEPATELYFFRFVLAWSRFAVTLVVRSLALPSTLAALRWSFERLGGVPARLVLDNPKTAVLTPKPHLALHPAFTELCRHYGCEPDPAWPYDPERKGKIERSFQDLVGAEILDRNYPNVAVLQSAVDAVEAARMKRLHTTIGEPPIVRFERERGALLVLPEVAFDPRVPESRRVLTDCCVSFGSAFYSVPHRFVGSRVVVKAAPLGDGIDIFALDELVASHRRVGKGQRSVLEEHVVELRRPRFERLRERARKAITKPTPRAPEPHELIAWPHVEVALRPIEDYAAALGGAR